MTSAEAHHQVMSVMTRYATSVDVKDLDRYATCFAEDLKVYGYGSETIVGRDRYLDYVREALTNYSRTQHLLGNFEIDVNGDEASMRSYVQAMHVPLADPEKVFVLWAIYDDRLIRTPDGWRITEHRLEPIARERGGRMP